jgi:hypothetical protein
MDQKYLESFENVVLENDGEDQLARSCEKGRNSVKEKKGICYRKQNKGRVTCLVISCVGTTYKNTLLMEKYKRR